MNDPRARKTLSWVLLAVSVAILMGGLIFDARTSGDKEVNLTGLYLAATLICAAAVFVGARARKLES